MRTANKAKAWIVSAIAIVVLACTSNSTSPTTQPAATATPVVEQPAGQSEPTATLAPAPTSSTTTTGKKIAATPTPLPTQVPAQLSRKLEKREGTQGGSLTVAGFADVPHRDVHQTIQETLTSMGPGLAYSRLLRLRPGTGDNQPSLQLECDLCLSWELTPDFAYEFQLREDVRWQNIAPVDGRALVADDLVFSYDRIRTPGWASAGLFASWGGVEALSPHRLRIDLAMADADALLSLADGHSKIVAREVVEQFGDLRESPVVGTGPWIWVESEDKGGTVLRRNPDYFEAGLPYLDELAIKPIRAEGKINSSGLERMAALQGGMVDMTILPPNEWRQLRDSGADIGSALSRQSGTGVSLAFNVRSEQLSDVAVRRAIWRAIDPWNYVDTVWAGQGFVSVGIPVPTSDWLLGRNEMRGQYFADPGMARETLREALIKTGSSGEIEITVRTEEFGDAYLDLEQRLTEDLRQVGFDPSIRRLNPSQFSDIVLNQRDYQIALGVLPPTSTTNSFLMALLHSQGRWNISGHQNLELDGMIEAQAAESDPEKREDMLKEIQRQVMDEAYLFSPVTGASRWVFDPLVRGFHPNTALSEYHYWSQVWLDR
jgi:peptide/nickel transport system substrate-binding protein